MEDKMSVLKKFCSVLLFAAVCCAVSAAPWTSFGPKRKPVTLLITANYVSHAMIKALVSPIDGCNGIEHKLIQQLLQSLSILRENSLLNGCSDAALLCFIQNFLLVDNSNFLVWNRKVTQEIPIVLRIHLRYTHIAGNQQKTIHAIWIILNFRINHIGVHIGGDALIQQQFVKILCNFRSGRCNHLTQSIVATGRLPESFQRTVIRNIVDDRLGVENFCW